MFCDMRTTEKGDMEFVKDDNVVAVIPAGELTRNKVRETQDAINKEHGTIVMWNTTDLTETHKAVVQ